MSKKIWAIILAPLSLILLAIIFFNLFPLILETQPEVAGWHNITEYQALPQIVDLAPLLIFMVMLIGIFLGVWAMISPGGPRKKWDEIKGKISGQRPWDS